MYKMEATKDGCSPWLKTFGGALHKDLRIETLQKPLHMEMETP